MKKPTTEERLERIERAILRLAEALEDGEWIDMCKKIAQTLSPLTDGEE